MQFLGLVQGKPARILLDSGSLHTFIISAFAEQLMGCQKSARSIQVTVANGAQLVCNSEFPRLSWSIQDCSFVSSARVLLLAQFDLIVGMDWLAQHSPMQVDWHHKWLLIPYESSTV